MSHVYSSRSDLQCMMNASLVAGREVTKQMIYILHQGPPGSNHAEPNSIFTWSLEIVASGGRLIAETFVEDGGISRGLVISSLPPLQPFSHRLFQKLGIVGSQSSGWRRTYLCAASPA